MTATRTDLTETQQGVDLKLARARVRLAEAQKAYDAGRITADELLRAEEAFRSLRLPLMSAALKSWGQS